MTTLASTSQAPAGEQKRHFRAERPAISVSLIREGRYLKYIRVEARTRCSDGSRGRNLYRIMGSGTIDLTKNGRFNRTRMNAHEHRVFKGRLDGDVIRGVYRSFSDGPAEDGFKPRCGTGTPNSRPIFFVAR